MVPFYDFNLISWTSRQQLPSKTFSLHTSPNRIVHPKFRILEIIIPRNQVPTTSAWRFLFVMFGARQMSPEFSVHIYSALPKKYSQKWENNFILIIPNRSKQSLVISLKKCILICFCPFFSRSPK